MYIYCVRRLRHDEMNDVYGDVFVFSRDYYYYYYSFLPWKKKTIMKYTYKLSLERRVHVIQLIPKNRRKMHKY